MDNIKTKFETLRTEINDRLGDVENLKIQVRDFEMNNVAKEHEISSLNVHIKILEKKKNEDSKKLENENENLAKHNEQSEALEKEIADLQNKLVGKEEIYEELGAKVQELNELARQFDDL